MLTWHHSRENGMFHADVALFSQRSHALKLFSWGSNCSHGLVLARKSCTNVILARNILGEDVLTWHQTREKHFCYWHYSCEKVVPWRATILARKSCPDVALTRKSLADVSPFSQGSRVLTSISRGSNLLSHSRGNLFRQGMSTAPF